MLAIGYRIGSLKMRLGCGLVGKRVATLQGSLKLGLT